MKMYTKTLRGLRWVGLGAMVVGLFLAVNYEANAQNATRSWYRAPLYGDSVRTFANQRAAQFGLTHIPEQFDGQGAVNMDSITAGQICKWAGYKKVQSMGCDSDYGSGCGFSSPHNNVLAKWNPSRGDFDLIRASTAGNRWLSSLVCAEPIVAPTPTTMPTPTPSPTQCSNRIDDDGDHKIDMKDPGCSSPQDNDERNSQPHPYPTPVPTVCPIPSNPYSFSPILFDGKPSSFEQPNWYNFPGWNW